MRRPSIPKVSAFAAPRTTHAPLARPRESVSRRERYLHAVVAVVRSPRRGEFAIVHFGSGKFFRTDKLGATAMLAMVDGMSDVDAAALAEHQEAGAASRTHRLVDALAATGAIAWNRPDTSTNRWRVRRLAGLTAGVGLGAAAPLVRHLPVRVLAGTIGLLPSSPVTD